MATLTRTEATTRAALITVVDTTLDLDLTDPGDTFGSASVLTVDVAEPGGSTFLDIKAVTVESVTVDGVPVDLAGWVDGRLGLDLPPGRHEIRTQTTMRYGTDGEGLHCHTAPDGERYLYAMSFLDQAPAWFSCFDQPDLKSPYTLVVRAPQDWLVRGNGRAAELSTNGGVTTWLLNQPMPLSTYFVTLVAGPYAEVRDHHDGIDLGLLVRADLAKELEEQAGEIFSVTKACFDGYHDLFGHRYPFGDYVQVFVPDFNAGAMENPGCVTFRDQFIHRGRATHEERGQRASTIAHEMAHQWFGDLVTMRWWDDLWLNESFAEYLAQVMCSRVTTYDRWLDFGMVRKEWGMLADQSSSTHPVAGNGTDDAAAALQQFDGISYAKGAAVLRQLVDHIGEDIFVAGLRDYFHRFGRGNAELRDLLQAWQDAGATDIDDWAEVWLRTTGVDQLRASGNTITRVPSDPAIGWRPHIATAARIDLSGQATVTETYRVADAPVVVDLPGEGLVIPDAHDQTWARIGLDWTSPVLDRPARIADPRTRVTVANALRDAVRVDDLPAAGAFERLIGWLAAEPETSLFTPLGQYLVTELAGRHCPVDQRAARRGAAHAMFTGLLTEAAAGSDLQLVALRLAIATLDDVDLGEQWLAGDLPRPITLDRELTWQLVTRLSSLDGDPSRIDTALVSDSSSAGRIHAARARAAIGTLEAKQAALAIVLGEREANAYETYATAESLFLDHQTEVTEALVEPWFVGIDATRDRRDGWVLGRAAALSFPGSHVERRTAELAEALIDDPTTHPAIRRSIADQLDRMRPALRSVLPT